MTLSLITDCYEALTLNRLIELVTAYMPYSLIMCENRDEVL